MKQDEETPLQTRPSRVLLGYMDELEGVGFLRRACHFEGRTDQELKELWSAARKAVKSQRERRLSPEIQDIGNEFAPQLEKVAANPTFSEVAPGGLPWAFKLVEIDRLVCFQQTVSIDYSRKMATGHDLSMMEDLIDFCLPTAPMKRVVGQSFDKARNVYTLLSSNSDLRILGQVKGSDPSTKRRFFGFAVGWGLPFISVVHLGDRYFLKNGYHRVYAIREQGIRHIPCVLIEGQKFEDTGGAKPGFFPEALLMSSEPPTFGDFLSKAIAPEVLMRETTKIVRISAEESILPVTMHGSLSEDGEAHVAAARGEPEQEVGERWDFEIESEGWNSYILADGSLVKLRQLLLRVGEPEPGAPVSAISIRPSDLLLSVTAPTGLLGEPTERQYSPEELKAAITDANIPFRVVEEAENSYILPNGMNLRLLLLSPTFSRTDKFDAEGEPIYIANVQTSVQVGAVDAGERV